jgi:hypothetical protein
VHKDELLSNSGVCTKTKEAQLDFASSLTEDDPTRTWVFDNMEAWIMFLGTCCNFSQKNKLIYEGYLVDLFGLDVSNMYLSIVNASGRPLF